MYKDVFSASSLGDEQGLLALKRLFDIYRDFLMLEKQMESIQDMYESSKGSLEFNLSIPIQPILDIIDRQRKLFEEYNKKNTERISHREEMEDLRRFGSRTYQEYLKKYGLNDPVVEILQGYFGPDNEEDEFQV